MVWKCHIVQILQPIYQKLISKVESVSVCICICVCVSSPAGWLCPVGITCHGVESLIDASCFSGGNYGAQMSRPNLWLCNVDTHGPEEGVTGLLRGMVGVFLRGRGGGRRLSLQFGQQMWGAREVTAWGVEYRKRLWDRFKNCIH